MINESPQDKLIRELREEIEALRRGGAVAGSGGGADNKELEAKLQAQNEEMKRIAAEREEWERKLAEQKQQNV